VAKLLKDLGEIRVKLKSRRVTEPALLETLKEVRTLKRPSNQLLDALGGSPAREL
jgi:hypothetical protein